MPLSSFLALLIAGACRAADAPKTPGLYIEPARGPRMIVDNMKSRKRLLGTDRYCLREILIDGEKVFGGNSCKVKHGEKHAVRLAPGTHRIVLDTISEWGGDDPDLPPISMSLDAQAGDKDFFVVLKGAKEPEIVILSTSTAAAPPAEPAPDPFTALERLKALYDKGVITAEEFKDKKAELLKSIR